ncbi:MBL fold metallo-hydrolase [Kitasatospora sp. NPDC056327]|uniref:MBL fold metallo-hydrolase n=1 Tax=Kitasatospora sp. NPDC056327 TaxID=3345785 RepID=UPI0035DC9A90
MTANTPRGGGPSRRSLLRTALGATATAAASAAVLGPGAPRAAARPGRPRPGSLGEQSAVRSLTLGDTRFTYVVDGAMELDPAGFLPAVPPAYWRDHPEALTPGGRIAASAGGVLVERGGRRLLIDVGLGANVLSPALGRSRGGALLDTLRALRVPPGSVDTVAFTHLHTDHTGLGFRTGRDRAPHRAFPRAAYLVAGAEWDPFWRREIEVGAPSWDDFMVPMSRVRRSFGNGAEIWPGVTALITPGHSPGHTSYVVTASGGRRLIVFGDAFHTPAQITNPGWPSGPDTDTAAVLRARRTLLAELAAPGTYGFAFHFGDQPFGRVVPDRSGVLGWRPVPSRVLLPAPIRLS